MRELKDNHIFLGMWLVWSLIIAGMIWSHSMMESGNDRIQLKIHSTNNRIIPALEHCLEVERFATDSFYLFEDNRAFNDMQHGYLRGIIQPLHTVCSDIKNLRGE